MKAEDRHFFLVSQSLAEGSTVPFLGAGANLCDRPPRVGWKPGRYTPSGVELARTLARSSGYPLSRNLDLSRVSQFVDAILGEGDLYRRLHTVFDANYPPSSLHRLIARLPALLRERGSPQLLVLTTNYDDLTERALAAEGERFDVVWYEAKIGPMQGRFLHRTPEGEVVPIKVPNKYTGLRLDERPVILKLHGAIDRSESKRDSYVVTENSYIDYLASGDEGAQIPKELEARMAESHFLFLGYAMRDWNLRVILSRIWRAEQLDLKSWAVQLEPTDPREREIEEALWHGRGDVDLVYSPLKEYVARLEDALFGPGSPAA